MKRTKKFATLLSMIMILSLSFTTLSINSNAMVVEIYDGIESFNLSTIDGEEVLANYDKETKVLTITGNGHIDSNNWYEMKKKKCTDFSINYYLGGVTIKFITEGTNKIFLPKDAMNFFADFSGDIIGLENLSIDMGTDMKYIFRGTKKFNDELAWDFSKASSVRGMFNFSNYSRDLNLDISGVTDIDNLRMITDCSGIKNLTLSNFSDDIQTDSEISSYGLDSLTIINPVVNVKIQILAGTSAVKKRDNDGDDWKAVLNSDNEPVYLNTGDIYTIEDTSNYKFVLKEDTKNINTNCTFDYKESMLAAVNNSDFMDKSKYNFVLKDNDGTVLTENEDYLLNLTIDETQLLNMVLTETLKVTLAVTGINDYSGSKILTSTIIIPKLEGEAEIAELDYANFEETHGRKPRLSDVNISRGSLNFKDDDNFKIYWLKGGLRSNPAEDFVLEIEQGKEYYYLATGNIPDIPDDSDDIFSERSIIRKVVLWPSDEEEENPNIGDDITPIYTDSTSEEEIPEEEIPEESPSFTDIASDSEYFEAANFVKEAGIIKGMGNDEFAPEVIASRAMVATVLYRMAGKPEVNGVQSLSDVMTGDWFHTPVLWGIKQGVITGYTDGTFKPSTKLSKEQIIAMLYRYAGKRKDMDVTSDYDISNLKGYDKIEEYALEAIKWAYKQEIINGDDIDPKDEVSRGELAQMLMKFMKKMKK